MARNRILFINNSSRVGIGTSVSLLSLIKHLHSDFQFDVVSDKEAKDLPLALDEYSIPHYALHDRTVLYLPQLIWLILREHYDLIYANNFSGRCKVALWAAIITRRPFIWHIREPLVMKPGVHFLPYADALVANSQDTANRVARFAHNKKITTIPNGVELEDYHLDRTVARQYVLDLLKISDESIVIANVGDIRASKNQLHALEVAAQLVQQCPEVYFAFLGHFPEEEYFNSLKKYINQVGLQKKVCFMGLQNNVNKFLFGSDILLHTAARESQGRVILEAMAANLPVVAYQVGGVGESIVDGKTGFLLPFGDINGLNQAVCRLIANPEERRRMGNAGYLRVIDLFSAEKTAELVKNVINQVLENRQRVQGN
jgi:glycosyltransferase involved in cell wall biosynthesis